MFSKYYAGAAACTLAMTCLVNVPAWAKVSAEEAARLGNELTCQGAEKAGNAEGTIPEYSGKWLGKPSGLAYAGTGTPYTDPYADEKPLYVITASNMEQYAAKLTDGQKALLKKYPDTFNLPIYKTHRDWAYPQWICDVSKKNAVTAELVDDGLGIKATNGSSPFPIPKSGLELVWNMTVPAASPREVGTFDTAVVNPSGGISWAREFHKIVLSKADPKNRVETTGSAAWSYGEKLVPQRDKGTLTYARVPYNYKSDFLDVWQYSPGTRRVRQLPNYGFDQPGPGGYITLDEGQVFNGSPERYNWKMVGKREIYVPYNTYKLLDPKLKYADLLKNKGHISPEYTRFELHRVWVVEAELKPGFRHLYPKRVMYIDEDTWLPLMGDNYDARGQFWRTVMNNTVYAYDAQTVWPHLAVYHDLVSGSYIADRLTNEQKPVMLVDDGSLKEEQFSPDMLRGAGR